MNPLFSLSFFPSVCVYLYLYLYIYVNTHIMENSFSTSISVEEVAKVGILLVYNIMAGLTNRTKLLGTAPF